MGFEDKGCDLLVFARIRYYISFYSQAIRKIVIKRFMPVLKLQRLWTMRRGEDSSVCLFPPRFFKNNYPVYWKQGFWVAFGESISIYKFNKLVCNGFRKFSSGTILPFSVFFYM